MTKRHLTLVRDESTVTRMKPSALLLVDPLAWANTLPKSDVFTTRSQPAKRTTLTGEIPQPAPLEGWRFHVTPYVQGYIVAARKGSLVVRKDKLNADQVREYVPR